MFKTTIHGLEDGSGALLLPREMLDSLNLQVGDELQIVETDDGVILRPIRHDNYKRQMNAARDVVDKYEAGLLQQLAIRLGC
ncbi:AbrB/MazE/SpoVT family DNA-binding domain-containing protein [Mesorhizobium sp. CA7]|uniref:AbrB/MazE/SpoVT family DNA-binding domain-containing protein n=1 Tax=Mesorhizobium sp. CA7 TaxID=588501 RepID=UPI001CC99AEC|nr:AbrB/MazE/SpoVT family DNA-binding domain-containing protein [Mesorhizobium sp. CA7]MBZ9814078.1 AbrB/MazE/SpoVT family DNA-binding domain-containing protein [Mesorhizobium sp. CA7]